MASVVFPSPYFVGDVEVTKISFPLGPFSKSFSILAISFP